MRFLLHGQLTPAVAEALLRHGHHSESADAVGLTEASTPRDIFETSRVKQLDVMTTERELLDATPQVASGRCVVFLQLDGEDVEQDDAIDRLFERYPRLSPGRLYTVTAGRVKVRQLSSNLSAS